jgi:hypothetical protein
MNRNDTKDYFKSKISKNLKDGIQSFYSQARIKSPENIDFFLSLTCLYILKGVEEELVQKPEEEDNRACIRGLVLDTSSNFFYDWRYSR